MDHPDTAPILLLIALVLIASAPAIGTLIAYALVIDLRPYL